MLYNWNNSETIPWLIRISLCLFALLIGSLTDLRKREVPDFVNYGLIFAGVGINLLFSIIYSDYWYILSSILGLAIFFCVAWAMFYTGQWGGGDSKMLMGLGATMGINISFSAPFFSVHQFLLYFLFNVLVFGALYGLLWSIFKSIQFRKKFAKEWKRTQTAMKIGKLKIYLLALVILGFGSFVFINEISMRILMLSFMFVMTSTFYIWIFIRTVEKTSMLKFVKPTSLTEGDWIVKDIYVQKKYVCGPKDLGISKSQIRKLVRFYRQGKIKNVLIKEGIPFVPSFFFAFLATLLVGHPLVWIF